MSTAQYSTCSQATCVTKIHNIQYHPDVRMQVWRGREWEKGCGWGKRGLSLWIFAAEQRLAVMGGALEAGVLCLEC